MSDTQVRRMGHYIIFGCAAIAALLFIGDMWFGIIAAGELGKITLSLIVVAGIIGAYVLIRRDLNTDSSPGKPAPKLGYYIVFVLAASAAILFLLALWLDIFSAGKIVKMMLTLGLLAMVVVVFVLRRRDLGEEEKMKKDGYMD
jgi:hypothetical protein